MDTSKVQRSGWAVADRWMRLLHLYTGIFLVPWMVVYALSALMLNHHASVNKLLGITPPKWNQIRQIEFQPSTNTNAEPRLMAQELLSTLDLDGAFRIEAKAPKNELRVLRISGSGNYRVIWNRDTGQARVTKQQPGSPVRFIHFLHFRAGYGMNAPAFLTWAVIVDLVGASILLWVTSGIYLWARQPRLRRWGGVAFGSGLVLFAILAWVMWH